jgi:Gpi18-like mannosyltransferase
VTGILCALALLIWTAGIVLFAAVAEDLIDEAPLLRMAAYQMPAAVALFLAVVIVFWPAAVIAKVLDALANPKGA